jgi:hypothetical protein
MKISIRNWSSIFELSDAKRTSKGTPLKWIAIPTKHDGRGLRKLLAMECGIEVFGAFILLCEVAAKMPVRGVLADEDGDLSLEDLSLKTGGSIKSFQKAIELLTDKEVKICWLTAEGEIPKDTSGYSEVAPLRTVRTDDTVRDGTERTKRVPAADASGTPPDKNPKAKPTPRKEATGPQAELIRFFESEWEERYGGKYIFQTKDGVAASKILKAVGGLEKAKATVRKFIGSDDKFLIEKRHPLPMLLSQINQFSCDGNGEGLTENELMAEYISGKKRNYPDAALLAKLFEPPRPGEVGHPDSPPFHADPPKPTGGNP